MKITIIIIKEYVIILGYLSLIPTRCFLSFFYFWLYLIMINMNFIYGF